MLAKDFSFTIYEVDDILNIAKDALIKTKSGAYRASLLGHGAAFANEAQDILSGLAKPRAMMKSSIQRYHNIHEMYDKR